MNQQVVRSLDRLSLEGSESQAFAAGDEISRPSMLNIRKVRSVPLPAKFEEFSLPQNLAMEASLVIPAVRAKWGLKYGEHAYYLMNFRTLRGFRVILSHQDIIGSGLDRLNRVSSVNSGSTFLFSALFKRYHYNFNFLEQIMLMTVPHTVTSIGDGRFIVNLWAYFGYLLIDCRTKAVTYQLVEDSEEDHVLGSQHYFDPQTDTLYGMSYSLEDSFNRIAQPNRAVRSRIFKHKIGSNTTETLWSGQMADYLHDLVVNTSRQYCVACELGMYLDQNQEIVPSKVIILDLKNQREWMLDQFIVAAHAHFDPEDPDVIYFSNHNFQFEHSNIFNLLSKGSYAVKFRGPASIFKYRLGPEGPREIGVFTQDDFYRLTNMHVFVHRGRKVIAAMGFPDEIFLIDADTMSFIRKVIIKDPPTVRPWSSNKQALIGSIAPSLNGEKLFVQTTRSFQVVDLESSEPDYLRKCSSFHSCFNHMICSTDTAWEQRGEL